MGELSAQLYGAADPAKTVAFASMISGIAAALTGQSAQGVAIASGAGANAAQNNYILHQDTYSKLVQACLQDHSKCTSFTDPNGVTAQPFGQTKNYQILALRDSQGKIVAYQAYNPLTGQTDYTMEPQDLSLFAQTTNFYAGLGRVLPQYALDLGLAGGYALQGDTTQSKRNLFAGATDPSYLQAVGESVVLTGLGLGLFARTGMPAVEGGTAMGSVADANFAQSTIRASEIFSKDGIAKYSQLAGRLINTVNDLAEALQSGAIKPSQIPVDYVVGTDGTKLILNTRTSVALDRAGIPKSDWYGTNKTSVSVPGMPGKTFDDLAADQLKNNKLPSSGTLTIPKGKN